MGGTPTFPCHARHADAELSPGTCFLHDLGYADMLPDLTFEFAGLLFTRVLSASTPGYVTFDLGNKAIAADPPGERGRFLAIDGTRTLIHNEEHWLLAVSPDLRFRVGEEHYVIPRHVCPCVAPAPAVLRRPGRPRAGDVRGDRTRPRSHRLILVTTNSTPRP